MRLLSAPAAPGLFRPAHRLGWLLAVVVFIGVGPARAQGEERLTPDALIEAMEAAAIQLDYETATRLARSAIDRYAELTPDQLVTVHTALGVLHHTRNEPLEARRQFTAALSIDPTLRLETVLISPKTVEFFDEIRDEIRMAGRPPETVVVETRYLLVPDRRPTAAVRSAAVPGWGQFHKGDRAKGWAFVLTATAATAGTVFATVARADARAAYLAATTPEETQRLYPSYDRWHRTRGAFVVGTAAVWAVAVADALITGAPEASPLAFGPSRESAGVRLRATF